MTEGVCTCRNFTVDEAFSIIDPRTGTTYWFKKDCPEHGYRVLDDVEIAGEIAPDEKSSEKVDVTVDAKRNPE